MRMTRMLRLASSAISPAGGTTISGLYAMEEVLTALQNKKITVLLVNIQEQPRYMLERIDIIPDLVPEEHVFPSFESCVEWVRDHVNGSKPQGE